jgi:hypothetical protein
MENSKTLKNLIEDLLKDRLTEMQIKKKMDQVGVQYTENPTTRWKLLLEKLGEEQPLQENNL